MTSQKRTRSRTHHPRLGLIRNLASLLDLPHQVLQIQLCPLRCADPPYNLGPTSIPTRHSIKPRILGPPNIRHRPRRARISFLGRREGRQVRVCPRERVVKHRHRTRRRRRDLALPSERVRRGRVEGLVSDLKFTRRGRLERVPRGDIGVGGWGVDEARREVRDRGTLSCGRGLGRRGLCRGGSGGNVRRSWSSGRVGSGSGSSDASQVRRRLGRLLGGLLGWRGWGRVAEEARLAARSVVERAEGSLARAR